MDNYGMTSPNVIINLALNCALSSILPEWFDEMQVP